MNFRKLPHRLLYSALFSLFLLTVVFSQNQLPSPAAQELAQKIASAKTESERIALLEQNKNLQTIDLRRALVRETDRLRLESEFDQAMRIDNFIAEFARKINDQVGVATALNGIGISFDKQGQYRTAIEYYNQAQVIRAAARDDLGTAGGNNNIGLSYLNLGEYALALQHFQTAQTQLAVINRTSLAATPLSNIGIVYRRLGNYPQAEQFYRRALALYETDNNQFGISQVLNNLGILQNIQGNYAAALELFNKSLVLREQLKNKGGICNSLNNIGEAYNLQADDAQSLDYYKRAARACEEAKIPSSFILSQIGIAQIYLRQNRPAEVLSLMESAAALARKTEDADLLQQALTLAGTARRRLKQPDLSRKILQEAIERVEFLRSKLSGEINSGNFLATKLEPYHELFKLEVDQNNLDSALITAERAKARFLLDVLSFGRAEINKSLTAAERRREAELNKNIIALNQKLARAREGQQTNPEKLKQLERELDQARLAYEALRTELYAAHPSLQAQRGEAKTITSDEIAGLLLKEPDKALLEYVVTKEATYLFVISKAGSRSGKSPVEIAVHKIPVSQKELSLLADSFRKAIATKDEYRAAARRLYDLLVAPARTKLGGKSKIVIVPDGALWNLPFQALLTAQNRFLLEDFVLSYAPSLTALREMRKIALKRASEQRNEKTLLAFGNPVFNSVKTETKNSDALERGGTEEILLPLPEAEKEVLSLSALYGAAHSLTYVKGEARESRVKTESKDFRVLQFATHGIFNDANPMYSYLLLSPDTESNDDGLLEARELMNLELSADLVVLSACETARGRISAGEGLTGMTWALFIAGVPTTVASQWKIPSASTTEIMIDFHHNLLRKEKSLDKAAALRQAELGFMRKGSLQHPFYWAGFVLVGNN